MWSCIGKITNNSQSLQQHDIGFFKHEVYRIHPKDAMFRLKTHWIVDLCCGLFAVQVCFFRFLRPSLLCTRGTNIGAKIPVLSPGSWDAAPPACERNLSFCLRNLCRFSAIQLDSLVLNRVTLQTLWLLVVGPLSNSTFNIPQKERFKSKNSAHFLSRTLLFHLLMGVAIVTISLSI